MTVELDNFLEHHGVKGMKWGVRKAEGGSTSSSGERAKASSASSTPRRSVPKPTSDQLKYVGKELAFGSIGPAAVMLGAGPPVSIALGISVGVLRTPPVQNAIKSSAKASASLMKEIGDTKLSAMREARESREKLRDAGKGVNPDLIDKLRRSSAVRTAAKS